MTRSNPMRIIGSTRNRVSEGLAAAIPALSRPATRQAAAAGDPAPDFDPMAEPVARQDIRRTSVQSRMMSQTLRCTLRPTFSLWSYTHRLPWPVDVVDRAAHTLPAIEGSEYQPVRLQNCDAEWLVGPGANTDHVVLYLHGGAFLCCGLHTHRRLVSRISAISQASVLSVAYRMLPHNTVSDAIEDGMDAYRWLLDNGYSAEQIVIAGDSAGGYLAFEVPLLLKAAGLPVPAGIVALSPLTELDPARKLAHRNSRRCSMFPRRAVPQMMKISDRMDERAMTSGGQVPRIDPVDADLRGMPPVMIHVGSQEMLYPDAKLISERLSQAGVPCELQVWARQPHVFPIFADVIPEGHEALAEAGRFIRSAHGALLTAVD